MTASDKRWLCTLFIPPQSVLLFKYLVDIVQFGPYSEQHSLNEWVLLLLIVNGFCALPGTLLYALLNVISTKGPSGVIQLLMLMAIAMIVGGTIGFAFDHMPFSEELHHPSFLATNVYLLAGLTAGLLTGGAVYIIDLRETRPRSNTAVAST